MTPESRINFIKDWLIKYIKSMPKPATSLVVGVSGGIDSAVVSTICSMTGTKNANFYRFLGPSKDLGNRGPIIPKLRKLIVIGTVH